MISDVFWGGGGGGGGGGGIEKNGWYEMLKTPDLEI